MNIEIIQGALVGGFGGLILAILLWSSTKKKRTETERQMKNGNLEENTTKDKSLLERWSIRLALLGIVLGIFTTLSQGYTSIGFMIGFGLPFALILGTVGLVIDLIKGRGK